tara:strand:+ start:476 stop:625 length:150 start_codon:yes stop_codon:yes gene_type:complete
VNLNGGYQPIREKKEYTSKNIAITLLKISVSIGETFLIKIVVIIIGIPM